MNKWMIWGGKNPYFWTHPYGSRLPGFRGPSHVLPCGAWKGGCRGLCWPTELHPVGAWGNGKSWWCENKNINGGVYWGTMHIYIFIYCLYIYIRYNLCNKNRFPKMRGVGHWLRKGGSHDVCCNLYWCSIGRCFRANSLRKPPWITPWFSFFLVFFSLYLIPTFHRLHHWWLSNLFNHLSGK